MSGLSPTNFFTGVICLLIFCTSSTFLSLTSKLGTLICTLDLFGERNAGYFTDQYENLTLSGIRTHGLLITRRLL